MNLNKNSIVSMIGMRKSGKSHLCKKILQESPRFLVYDTVNEYQPADLYRNRIKDNLKIEHGQNPKLDFKQDNFGYIYKPYDLNFNKFNAVCKQVLNSADDIVFVVEEVDTYAKSRSVIPEYFSRLINRQYHNKNERNLIVICLTRRPAECHKNIFANSDIVICFHTFLPNDVRYLSDFIPAKQVEQLKTLQDHKFLVWDGETAIISDAVKE